METAIPSSSGLARDDDDEIGMSVCPFVHDIEVLWSHIGWNTSKIIALQGL